MLGSDRHRRAATLLFCFCVVGSIAVGCGQSASNPQPSAAIAVLPAPLLGRFANARPGVNFCGAAKCAECHPAEAASYETSGHRHAFAPTAAAEEPPGGEFADSRSSRRYEIAQAEGRMRHRELLVGSDGSERLLADYPAAWTIGSGRYSRSYLIDVDGFLMQSPATWYAARPGWDLSPGYTQRNPGFERPITGQCMHCHVGRSEVVPETLQKFHIHTEAIDCERCHGPGALHAAAHVDSDERPSVQAFDPTIVHPGRLTRREQEDLCGQCHYHTGATVEVSGRRLQDFRPGQRLADFVVHVGRKSADEMRVVGHLEQLRQSRCYLSAETLTCTTCHHPHRPVAAEQRYEVHRNQCLACHTEMSCGVAQQERTARVGRDDCVKCHMPQAGTEIPHFAFTHHRIGIHRTPGEDRDREPGTLVLLDDVSHLPQWERDRCLALGAFQMLSTARSREEARLLESEALQRLTAVRTAGASDAEIDAALARLHWRRDPQKTIEFSRASLKQERSSPEARVTACFTLASTYLDAGQPQWALPLLQRLTQARWYSEDWFLLSRCWETQGNFSEALKAAQRAAAISPQYPELQEHLARLARAAGRPAEAADYLEAATELRRLSPAQRTRPLQ